MAACLLALQPLSLRPLSVRSLSLSLELPPAPAERGR